MARRYLRERYSEAQLALQLERMQQRGRALGGIAPGDPRPEKNLGRRVTCTACARTHWVNPKTRKVLDKK
jgi:hypothetical protein